MDPFELGRPSRPKRKTESRKPPGSTSTARSRQSSTGALKGVPVLIVDDDVLSAKLTAIILRAEGCRVAVAHSAEEALPLLASFQPQLIVVDLILPLMSGLLFVQRVKADPATRHIVVVAVTAFNGGEAEAMARQAGCAAYMQKPIDAVAFVALLEEKLGGGP